MKMSELKYFLIVLCCGIMGAGVAVNVPRGFNGSMFHLKSAVIEKDFKKARHYAGEAAGIARTPEQKLELRFQEAVIEAGTGNFAGAENILGAISGDRALDAGSRFKAFAVSLALKAVKDKALPDVRQLKEQAAQLRDAGLAAPGEYAALNAAAALMISLGQDGCAQSLIALADTLYKRETKVYTCRYVENAPLGAGGWFHSALLGDRNAREGRFDEYNRQSAAMLFADITAGRDAAAGGDARKDYYAGNTGFYMVYDSRGWHIFFLLGESELEDRMLNNKALGSLEVFFTPGPKGETYYQWMTRLPSGKTDVFDWNSPHRQYRLLGDFLKTETVTADNRIGSYAFIPWEALYDKLPLDGKPWRFSVIRWSPAGGFTWGGRVHETGAWGRIDWQKPTAGQALEIRKRIVCRAWANYNGSKQALTTFGTDPEIGDREFFDASLKSAIARLDGPAKLMGEADRLTESQIGELFDKYVPDWMEFDRVAAELRREYLENKLGQNR